MSQQSIPVAPRTASGDNLPQRVARLEARERARSERHRAMRHYLVPSALLASVGLFVGLLIDWLGLGSVEFNERLIAGAQGGTIVVTVVLALICTEQVAETRKLQKRLRSSDTMVPAD